MDWILDQQHNRYIGENGAFRAEVWEAPYRLGVWAARIVRVSTGVVVAGVITRGDAMAWCEAEVRRHPRLDDGIDLELGR